MANPAQIIDLEARFRPLSEAEKANATAWLTDAWAIVLSSVPDLENRMAAGHPSEPLVRSVVTAMVIRVLRNPDAIRQWAVDDASFTRDTAMSAGALYVSPEEVALLAPAGSGAAVAFTIRPSGSRDTLRGSW